MIACTGGIIIYPLGALHNAVIMNPNDKDHMNKVLSAAQLD